MHQNVRAPKCPYTETSYTDKSGSYLADTSAVCHPESGVPLNKLILKAFILKVPNTIIARLDAAITCKTFPLHSSAPSLRLHYSFKATNLRTAL